MNSEHAKSSIFSCVIAFMVGAIAMLSFIRLVPGTNNLIVATGRYTFGLDGAILLDSASGATWILKTDSDRNRYWILMPGGPSHPESMRSK